MTRSAERARIHSAVARRLPDFYIVGHAKSGTTALYEMLRRHPEIYMPSFQAGFGKEPHYFSRLDPSAQTRPAMPLEEYIELFAAAQPHERVGEASTSYLWSPTAARRIAEARPDARIIAILREPASFLHSLHLQTVQNRGEPERSFRRALALDEERRHGRRLPASPDGSGAVIYSDRVRYVEQLRRYHAVFDEEQVLVLIYEDFRADNEATVRRVLRFLEVDDGVRLAQVESNPSVALRSVGLDRAIRSLRAGRGPLTAPAKALIKGLTPSRFRYRVLYPLRNRILYGRPEPADEQLMLDLRARFYPEVRELSDYLGRDLVRLWGYERFA